MKHVFFASSWVLSAAMIVNCSERSESTDDIIATDKANDTECTDCYAPWFGSALSCPDKSELCVNLPHPEDCIADFGLGTTQEGSSEMGYETHVGFYGYNDGTETGTMMPIPDDYDSEPTVFMDSCEKKDDSVMHLSGEGYERWGFGIRVDWGGAENPDCATDAALECIDVLFEDAHFNIAAAEADPRCQDADGNPDPVKMRCLIHGKRYKTTRDLSMYRGIGFFVGTMDADAPRKMQVRFPVPESMRFMRDPLLPEAYRREDISYDNGCSDDDDDETNDCNNDFFAEVDFEDALGRWTYKEILFENLGTSSDDGLQLADDAFPATQSVGVAFQSASPGQYLDVYIDDIHFVR